MAGRQDAPEKATVEPLRGFDDFDLHLGDIMRGERATMGKSLLDVQRDLKIKAPYIAAIENADPSAFESPGFVAGYVRSYARYLGLDPEWAYQTFCQEGGFSYQPSGLKAAPTPARRDGRKASVGIAVMGKAANAPAMRDPFKQPSVSFIPVGQSRFSQIEPGAIGSMMVLVALVAAIGYGGWSVLQEVQKVQFAPVDQIPGVLSELDPVAPAPFPEEDDTDLAELTMPTTDAFDRLYRPQALDVPVFVPRDAPIATITPGSLGVLVEDRPAGVSDTPVYADEETPPLTPLPPVAEARTADAGTAIQVVEDGPPQVELFAVRPSWVRVRAADGTVVFEKILDAGERFSVPKTEEAHTLRAGNSGSVYFSVGGKTYGPAGTGAAVVKNVVISATSLPQAYALADPGADADLARFTAVAEAQGN